MAETVSGEKHVRADSYAAYADHLNSFCKSMKDNGVVHGFRSKRAGLRVDATKDPTNNVYVSAHRTVQSAVTSKSTPGLIRSRLVDLPVERTGRWVRAPRL
jgi:O-glycosyl hydrolase